MPKLSLWFGKAVQTEAVAAAGRFTHEDVKRARTEAGGMRTVVDKHLTRVSHRYGYRFGGWYLERYRAGGALKYRWRPAVRARAPGAPGGLPEGRPGQ